jgi:hypothetical protein
VGRSAADTKAAGEETGKAPPKNPEEHPYSWRFIVMRKLIPVVGPLLAAVLAMVPILGAILAAVVA